MSRDKGTKLSGFQLAEGESPGFLFLREAGVADYQLVDSQGATEGTIKNLTAEAVADITSTGETLRANHLKILSDGLMLKSQATLFRARKASMDDTERATMDRLLTQLNVEA